MDATGISQENMTIFSSISDLVSSADFRDATVEFMQKHMDTFDESDENKLEYTTIFEEYVQILESTIDTQLYKSYPEPQIKAFYNNFKDNFSEYAKINEDTVETLFGFTDFNKFKKQVLEIKKTATKVDDTEDLSTGDGMLQIDEASFWKYYNSPITKEEGWVKKIEHKGNCDVTLYQKDVKIGNKNHYLNYSDCRYKGISKKVMEDFFDNFDKIEQKAVKETKIIKDETGKLKMMYQRMKMPLMSERDFVLEFDLKEIKDGEHAGKTLWIMRTIQHPDYPLREKCIRMFIQKGFLFWQEGKDTVGVELATFDMGGMVPRKLLNMSIGAQVK